MVTGRVMPPITNVGGVIVTPCNFMGAVPVLEIVTNWVALAVPSDWLEKVRELGLTLTTACVASPVPVRGTARGLPTCWVSVYVQLNVFAESGAKIIEKEVEAFGASVVGV